MTASPPKTFSLLALALALHSSRSTSGATTLGFVSYETSSLPSVRRSLPISSWICGVTPNDDVNVEQQPPTSAQTLGVILSALTIMIERLETARRKTLAWLNSRYIYGRVPFLHTLVFAVEMVIIMRLIAKFNSYYAQKPMLTTMVTNAVLGGIADTVAQSITAYQIRTKALPQTAKTTSFVLSDGVELDDFNEKAEEAPPRPAPIYLAPKAPPPFDFERITRFMAYGFLMSPIQFKWYGFLNRTFPVTNARGLVPALQRVAMDQLVFAPFGLTCFFTFMTVAEGGGLQAIQRKFLDVYVPTLRANFILWPAVQIINFRLMPIQFQIPFVSTIGIAWTAYLSLTNSSEDDIEETWPAGVE